MACAGPGSGRQALQNARGGGRGRPPIGLRDGSGNGSGDAVRDEDCALRCAGRNACARERLCGWPSARLGHARAFAAGPHGRRRCRARADLQFGGSRPPAQRRRELSRPAAADRGTRQSAPARSRADQDPRLCRGRGASEPAARRPDRRRHRAGSDRRRRQEHGGDIPQGPGPDIPGRHPRHPAECGSPGARTRRCAGSDATASGTRAGNATTGVSA